MANMHHIKMYFTCYLYSFTDKVHAVFSASLKLLEYLLNDFIPKHKLGKAETSRTCSTVLPNLIQKTGETVSVFI